MSGSKMSRNEASITARCQGGGDKLAGTAPSVGAPLPSNRAAYSRVNNTTATHRAYKMLGNVCKNAGCGCDAALNSMMCQGNIACRSMFPVNQNPVQGGVHARRWARGGKTVVSLVVS